MNLVSKIKSLVLSESLLYKYFILGFVFLWISAFCQTNEYSVSYQIASALTSLIFFVCSIVIYLDGIDTKDREEGNVWYGNGPE